MSEWVSEWVWVGEWVGLRARSQQVVGVVPVPFSEFGHVMGEWVGG